MCCFLLTLDNLCSWGGGVPGLSASFYTVFIVPQSFSLLPLQTIDLRQKGCITSYRWSVHSHDAACRRRGFFGAIWAPSSECRAAPTRAAALKKENLPLKKITTKCPGSHRQLQMHPKGLNAKVTFKNLSSVSCVSEHQGTPGSSKSIGEICT